MNTLQSYIIGHYCRDEDELVEMLIEQLLNLGLIRYEFEKKREGRSEPILREEHLISLSYVFFCSLFRKSKIPRAHLRIHYFMRMFT